MLLTILVWSFLVSIGFTAGYSGLVVLMRMGRHAQREQPVPLGDPAVAELEAWWDRSDHATRGRATTDRAARRYDALDVPAPVRAFRTGASPAARLQLYPWPLTSSSR